MKKFIAPVLAFSLLAAAAPVIAHGKLSCKSGPKTGWQNIDKLTSKLKAEGWTIKKAHPEKDCYEVYGKTPDGDNVEAFFHPVSFKKIMVMKRGTTLFRAPGY